MANRYFKGEKIGFAAQLTDDESAVVTDMSATLQVFRSGASKPMYEFPMVYDSTNQSFSYVWDTTEVKGAFTIRAVVKTLVNNEPVVSNESVNIEIEP